MKIIFRISLTDELKDTLFNSTYWDTLPKSGKLLDLEWPSDRTREVLALLSGHTIDLWHAYMTFNPRDLRGFGFYELVLTQVTNISKTDCRLYDADRGTVPTTAESRIGDLPYFVPRKIVASSIKLNENALSSYGGFSDEIITSSYVVDELKTSKLDGWADAEILRRDGTIHTIYRRLVSESLLSVTSEDLSILVVRDEYGNSLLRKRGFPEILPYLRYFGCKTMREDTLVDALDFNRMLSNEHPEGYAGWIVSADARQFLKDRKIRGTRYRPILNHGTVTHNVYVEMWAELMSLLFSLGATHLGKPLEKQLLASALP